MAVQNPILNPIRFYDPTALPNYADRWPNMDNVSFHTEWQKGIYASNFYRDFVLNKELLLEFRFDTAITDSNIYVYKLNETTGVYVSYSTIVPTNITPTGWTSLSVYLYSFTPTETGVYYLDFDDADLLSDKFIVHNDPKELSQLVEITYSHYENRYGMLYFQNGSPVFVGRAYFQGNLQDGEPTNDISQFISDPGEVELLQATPQRATELNILTTHYVYNDVINYIFSNSEIYVNGVKYQNSEAPAKEKINGSDLRNFTVQLFQRNNEHFIL